MSVKFTDEPLKSLNTSSRTVNEFRPQVMPTAALSIPSAAVGAVASTPLIPTELYNMFIGFELRLQTMRRKFLPELESQNSFNPHSKFDRYVAARICHHVISLGPAALSVLRDFGQSVIQGGGISRLWNAENELDKRVLSGLKSSDQRWHFLSADLLMKLLNGRKSAWKSAQRTLECLDPASLSINSDRLGLESRESSNNGLDGAVKIRIVNTDNFSNLCLAVLIGELSDSDYALLLGTSARLSLGSADPLKLSPAFISVDSDASLPRNFVVRSNAELQTMLVSSAQSAEKLVIVGEERQRERMLALERIKREVRYLALCQDERAVLAPALGIRDLFDNNLSSHELQALLVRLKKLNERRNDWLVPVLAAAENLGDALCAISTLPADEILIRLEQSLPESALSEVARLRNCYEDLRKETVEKLKLQASTSPPGRARVIFGREILEYRPAMRRLIDWVRVKSADASFKEHGGVIEECDFYYRQFFEVHASERGRAVICLSDARVIGMGIYYLPQTIPGCHDAVPLELMKAPSDAFIELVVAQLGSSAEIIGAILCNYALVGAENSFAVRHVENLRSINRLRRFGFSDQPKFDYSWKLPNGREYALRVMKTLLGQRDSR